MAVVRWDPWRDISTLERQMNEVLGWMRRPNATGPSDRMWTPLIEAYEEGDRFVIRAELAGVRPEDVELTVEGDMLCIRGERQEQRSATEQGGWIRREFSSGRFERVMQLEPGTDADAISARVEDGILEVTVPNPARSQTRRIEIDQSEEGGAGGSTNIEVGGGSRQGDAQTGAQSGATVSGQGSQALSGSAGEDGDVESETSAAMTAKRANRR